MIDPRRPSRQQRVMKDQAVLLAWIIRDLIGELERDPGMDLLKFLDLSSYQRFKTGVCACGFYCRDGSGMQNFSDAMGRPQQLLNISSISDARKFIYSVMENERNNQDYSSTVRHCVINGALGILADRLEDGSLRETSFIPPTLPLCTAEDEWDMLHDGPNP